MRSHKLNQKQLTPRQGTKTSQSGYLLSKYSETTYTPSGDENLEQTDMRAVMCRKQLTPRQGTKTFFEALPYQGALKQLTPRQGTKTRNRPVQRCCS